MGYVCGAVSPPAPRACRMPGWGSACPWQAHPHLPEFTDCVTLGELLSLAGPRYLHQWCGGDADAHIRGCWDDDMG